MSWQIVPTNETDRPRETLSIGEVCRRTGLSARTVRYYEELALLPGVRRSEGGRRVYGADEIERLRFIGRLKTLGLSLSEIKQLNAVYAIEGSTRAMLCALDELLGLRLDEVDRRIAALEGLRGEMRRYRRHVRGRIEALGEDGSEAAGGAEQGHRRKGAEER